MTAPTYAPRDRDIEAALRSRIVERVVPPPTDAARADVGMAPDENVASLRRVRHADDLPETRYAADRCGLDVGFSVEDSGSLVVSQDA